MAAGLAKFRSLLAFHRPPGERAWRSSFLWWVMTTRVRLYLIVLAVCVAMFAMRWVPPARNLILPGPVCPLCGSPNIHLAEQGMSEEAWSCPDCGMIGPLHPPSPFVRDY